MKTKPTDRRTQRTIQLLREALMALIMAKRYETITVQDILERANVGRSTFYTHYYDKDDLLLSNLEWLIETLSAGLAQGLARPQAHLPTLALFQHVQQHYYLYEALARGQAAEMLLKRVQTYLTQTLEAQLQRQFPPTTDNAPPLSALAAYTAGTFVLLLHWWLENKMPYSPEQMDALFRQLVLPGLRQVLGERGKQLDL